MRRSSDVVRDERGMALVTSLLVVGVLSLVAIFMIDIATSEQARSSNQLQRETAYQAAEAGIDDYLAKLLADPLYYLHYMHAAEPTRRSSTGVSVSSAGTHVDWLYTNAWTYPNGKDNWARATTNGYQYTLQVTPPSAANPAITLVSTGRPPNSTNIADYRAIEIVLSPSSIARYYRIVDGDIGFGSNTTTDGQVYSNGTITHSGYATANLYAVDEINGDVDMQNGATKNESQPPINFSAFLTSLVDIQRASQAGGVYLNNGSVDAWKLVFSSAGTFTAQACTETSGDDVAETPPTCGATTTYTVPSNGAVYTPQTAIVSGSVRGRVTVASNDEIVLGGPIAPVTAGTDVIGLNSLNDFVIAAYVPSVLDWSAAVLSQTGTWKTYESGTDSHSSMTFAGSAATANGGNMTMFVTRTYAYEPALQYLPPPWFPSIGSPYTRTLFRERTPSTS